MTTIWTFRAHEFKDFNQRIFKRLSATLNRLNIPLVLSLNVKPENRESLVEQWQKFVTEIGAKVDTFVLLDEELIKKKYPSYEGGWRDGQIHMIEIGEQLKWDFEHLMMSDPDLDFSGNFEDFWAIVNENRADFLGPLLRSFREEPDWGWWPTARPEKKLWRSFLPLIRASSRLLKVMQKMILGGEHYFCEIMFPTEAALNFGELNCQTFPLTTVSHGSFRYEPPLNPEERQAIFDCEQFRWYHPVKE